MSERYTIIQPSASASDEAKLRCLRLNALGSLYFFTQVILRRRRLTESCHKPFCDSLEHEHVKDVVEFPRDHFKSTICSEARPMWRALPLTQEDLDGFAALGYSDEFIRYQTRIHDPNRRMLLVSENLTNARKLGSRIRSHFESNAVYRACFPETLPTPKETWTGESLHVRRPTGGTGGSHGEGTFDFIGVGSALQSRHYHEITQDDLVGRKAQQSIIEMDKTIDYHKLLAGAFENEDKDHDADELVVGNRWAYTDLNSHIREHEPWFRVTSHSALGGCCSAHLADTPIFPEEYSFAKLEKLKRRFGSYNFSCQYLNNPSAPEDADFKTEWLRYYRIVKAVPEIIGSRDTIVHEVNAGEVVKDKFYTQLAIAMVTDPAHSGNAGYGRCRHAIVVVGLDGEGNWYLLEYWANHASYDTYIAKIYELARKWKLTRFGVEAVAAQKYLAYHLTYRNKIEGNSLRVIELKGEVEGPDGTLTRNKEWRIRNVLQPIFESGRFWCQRVHVDFTNEYQTFPKGRYVDILDALAYISQMVKQPISSARNQELLAANRAFSRQVGQPYGYM